ncbi:MAG: PTS sugar transporter subunit IIB [Erysipelotrichaceae bacterium]
MINLLRVDDRLLHGQVAIAWSRNLRLDLILIANSEAVNDEFTIMTLNLAKPRNVQIVIEDLENTIDLLKSNYFDKNIMIVVKNVEDAYKLSQSIFEIKNLNLGGIRERRNSVKITPYVSLTQSDFNQLSEMNKYMHVFIQKIPEDVIIEFEEVKKCYLSY